MLPRFFAPALDPRQTHVQLPAEEAHHLSKVLRLAEGDAVAVFDGRGTEFSARVESAARDAVLLRLIEQLPVPPPPAVRIVLAQAMLKGRTMEDVIRDATMMGVDAVAPLLTAHADVRIADAKRPQLVERWQRIALASAKQSRRATLPEVHPPRGFDEWLAAPPAGILLLFVEPAAACAPRPLKHVLEFDVPARAAILIGPEGGWAKEELDRAVAHGAIVVSLGPMTLRAESMPLAALAALNALWA